MRYFEIFLLVFCATAIFAVAGDMIVLNADENDNDNGRLPLTQNQQPSHDQQSTERKSGATNNARSNVDGGTVTKADHTKLDEPIEPESPNILLPDYLHINAPIKIVKAPDLFQEKEAALTGDRQTVADEQDGGGNRVTTGTAAPTSTANADDKDQIEVTEFISNLIEKRLKWVKKLEEEFENLDEMLLEEDEPPRELFAWQIELEELYESAMKILNKSRADKTAGYEILEEAAKRGHSKSGALIGWAQLFGNPLEMNIAEAKRTFGQLAELGVPEAHMGLGFMYAAGIGFNVSQSRALVHYTMAAAGGDSWAQMVLGYRYWAGITVPTSCEMALEFYRKVATSVASQVTFSGGAAIHRIRLLDEVENSGLSANIVNNDVIEYYQLLADKGDVQTQVGLGQLHYQGGHGIPVDHQRALHYFLPAANAGNAVAMAFLGKIYLEGSENIKADNETAFKYFSKAAELGNPVGQSGLGLMYLQGKGVSKDTAKAYNYFTQAAEQGWVDGQLQLGNMYFGE